MNQQEAAAGINLTQAFMTYQGNRDFIHELVIPTEQNPVDPTASILVLQALYNIEETVQGGQFNNGLNVQLKGILRKWRCESEYGQYNDRRAHVLRSLNIFEVFGVPLFIDSYGVKQRLSDYDSGIEPIGGIDGNTKIHHVTHEEEAENISTDREFKPSANKNIIPGCWFGLQADDSPYGTHSFRTKLSALGITGLHQGEIVSYKREVNMILYADDDDEASFTSLMKPTLEAVKSKHGQQAYVHVSIFVPERFLPQVEDFRQVVEEVPVERHTMCVRQLRTRYECKEFTE